MNSTFSLRRVLWYARKHYTENSRTYLLGLLGFIGLLVLISYLSYRNSGSYYLMTIMMIIAAIILGVQLNCRDHYKRRSLGQSYTLPANSSEKYLFIWFNSSLLIPAILFTTAVLLLKLLHSVHGIELASLKEFPIQALLTIFGVQASVLFTCCWVKGSPLKGYLFLGGAFLAGFLLYPIIMKHLFDLHPLTPFSSCSHYFKTDTAFVFLEFQPVLSDTTEWLVNSLWIPVLWIAAYFKFRERTLK